MPARVIRRALSAAARKAADVEVLVVVAVAPVADTAARRLARRALGPTGSSVPMLVAVGAPPPGAEAPGDEPWPRREAVAMLDGGSAGPWTLAVALGLAEARCVALCLARG